MGDIIFSLRTMSCSDVVQSPRIWQSCLSCTFGGQTSLVTMLAQHRWRSCSFGVSGTLIFCITGKISPEMDASVVVLTYRSITVQLHQWNMYRFPQCERKKRT